MTTATGAIALDDAKATGSATTSFREALAARLAAELDDAARWLAPTPDPPDRGGAVNGSAPRLLVLHELVEPLVEPVGDEAGSFHHRHTIAAVVSDDEQRARQEAEQAAHEEKDAAELAAAIAIVRASLAAIVDGAEREVDQLIATIVKDDPDDVFRAAVKARIRPDLIAWPTPWVRPRDFVDIPTTKGGTVRTYGLAGGEEQEARARHPELAALARLMVEREARRIAADHPDALQEARRVLAGYERDTVASEAWRAIGDEQEAGEALRLAARLAGADLARAAASGARGRRAEGPRTARGDVDHVEVPGVGWVYASTLALVGHALQQAARPAELAKLAAGFVLNKAKDDELARLPEAALRLARAVEDLLPRSPACRDVVDVVEDVHPLDKELAALLASIGKEGRDRAKIIRKAKMDPQERADRWRPYVNPLRVSRLLARALWFDVERNKLKQHPALTRAIHSGVAKVLVQGLDVEDDGHVVDRNGKQLTFVKMRELKGEGVLLVDQKLAETMRRGTGRLGSVSAHRVVRGLVELGNRQVLDGHADPRVVVFEGGWVAFADAIGEQDSTVVREIVVALAHGCFSFPGGTSGNLLIVTEPQKATRGQRATVKVIIGDKLLPQFVHSLPDGQTREAIENRQLVPIVGLPPFHGRKNDHGPQATLQMMFMTRLRAGAQELARTGWVRIPAVELEALARDANLPKGLLPKVLDCWANGTADTAPFIVRDGDRFTLANTHAAALAFLRAAGERSLERSAEAKALREAKKGAGRD